MSIANNKILNIAKIIEKSRINRLDVELLLSFLLNTNREFIISHLQTRIKAAVYKKYLYLEKLRLKNWPLAYLVGKKEFYGLDFKVNASVLIPRPETELIIEEVLTAYSNDLLTDSQKILIDLGTGSGAIIIALMHEIQRHFPNTYLKTKARAVDISKSALAVARVNAQKHQLNSKIKFFCGNLLTPLKLNHQNILGSELIITANLPYLTKKQIQTSPSICHEPRLALDGGINGLKYYQELFKQIAVLNLASRSLYLFCEIDPGQATNIKKLAKILIPHSKIIIKHDLARRRRLAIIKF